MLIMVLDPSTISYFAVVVALGIMLGILVFVSYVIIPFITSSAQKKIRIDSGLLLGRGLVLVRTFGIAAILFSILSVLLSSWDVSPSLSSLLTSLYPVSYALLVFYVILFEGVVFPSTTRFSHVAQYQINSAYEKSYPHFILGERMLKRIHIISITVSAIMLFGVLVYIV